MNLNQLVENRNKSNFFQEENKMIAKQKMLQEIEKE